MPGLCTSPNTESPGTRILLRYRYTWLGKVFTCGQALPRATARFAGLLVQRLLPILAAAARSYLRHRRGLACQTRVRDICSLQQIAAPDERPAWEPCEAGVSGLQSGRNHMRLGRHSASSLLRASDCTRHAHADKRQENGGPNKCVHVFPCYD